MLSSRSAAAPFRACSLVRHASIFPTNARDSAHLAASIASLVRGDTGAGARAAQVLARARAQEVPELLETPPAHGLSTEMGYALQGKVNAALGELGWKSVGFKIGATSKSIQERLGILEPFFGEIFDRRTLVKEDARDARTLPVVNPRGIEVEWGFVMKKELPARREMEVFSEDQVKDAIAFCLPCIEVTGTRLTDSSNAAMTFADGAGNGLVIAAPRSAWRSVEDAVCINAPQVKVTTKVNGKVVAEGDGSQVLGHPLKSMTWFANQTSRRALSPGELVISGAANGMHPIPSNMLVEGAHVEAIFENWYALDIILRSKPIDSPSYTTYVG